MPAPPMHRTIDTQGESSLRTLLHELGAEARNWRFDVAPNPCVGAAVLAGTRVVSRGFHTDWGGPHAEVAALRAATSSPVDPSEWDTLAVTLEPCSSTGKTPPCVDAILNTSIRRVVVGELDPDPRHRGRGLELLREAGLEVILLERVSPLQDVAPHFLRWNALERVRRPRPWTIAKWAQTLSGQLSPPEEVGQGRWISSPESLAEVQLLRAHVDAIVTGVGTVLADDPRLSVRPPGSTTKPPIRVVLDSILRTPPEARLFAPCGEDESAGAVHLISLPGTDVARHRALLDAGAEIHGLRGPDRGHVDLRELQEWLWSQGVRRVMIEAGPELLGSYFDAGFVDQIQVITGDVRGGCGENLGLRLASLDIHERRDREVGSDAVLEGFLIDRS